MFIRICEKLMRNEICTLWDKRIGSVVARKRNIKLFEAFLHNNISKGIRLYHPGEKGQHGKSLGGRTGKVTGLKGDLVKRLFAHLGEMFEHALFKMGPRLQERRSVFLLSLFSYVLKASFGPTLGQCSKLCMPRDRRTRTSTGQLFLSLDSTCYATALIH